MLILKLRNFFGSFRMSVKQLLHLDNRAVHVVVELLVVHQLAPSSPAPDSGFAVSCSRLVVTASRRLYNASFFMSWPIVPSPLLSEADKLLEVGGDLIQVFRERWIVHQLADASLARS